MKTKILFGALSSAVFSIACAEDTILPEVAVTATRLSQPLAASLSATSVLNQQDIQAAGVPDLPSLLSRVTGLDIYQSGGIGKQSSLFVRGSNSQHVLVLVDGVRVGSATVGITAIQDIMLDQVERIEVVRGNVSSVYGSQAIGGVVQIFTKQGKDGQHINFSASVSRYSTARVSTGFAGGNDKNKVSVQLSQMSSNGFSAMDTSVQTLANPDRDGYDNTSATVNWQHDFSDKHHLAVNLFNANGNSDYDAGQAEDFTSVEITQQQSKQVLNSASVSLDNQFADNWISKIQLAQGDDKNEAIGSYPAEFVTKNQQLNWQNELFLGENNTLLLGTDWLQQKVDTSAKLIESKRTTKSLYAGYTGQYNALQVQLNARHDDNSQFGTANTGLFGLGYAFATHWRVNVNYSTAFNAPTFNDLYWPLSFGYQGNPNLKPERSRNHELGFSYNNRNQSFAMRYFDNRITDLISIESDYSTMNNLNKAQIQGYELEYAASYGDTTVDANLTLQDPHDEATGNTLLRRAKQMANIGLQHKLANWNLMSNWHHRGKADDVGGKVDAINTFNLGADYLVNKQLTLSMKLNNVTDQNDSAAYGYNSAGRVWMLGVNYQQ